MVARSFPLVQLWHKKLSLWSCLQRDVWLSRAKLLGLNNQTKQVGKHRFVGEKGGDVPVDWRSVLLQQALQC